MEYLNLRRIYSYYSEEIDPHKLYRIKDWKLIVTRKVTLPSCIVLFLIYAKYKNIIYYYAAMLIYCIWVVVGEEIRYKIANMIIEEYKLTSVKRNEVDLCYRIARSRKFIEFLNKEGIRTKEQKECLIKILSDLVLKHTVDKPWVIGGAIALLIPVWDTILGKVTTDNDIRLLFHYLRDVSVLISIILGIAIVLHMLIKFILRPFNRKGRRYKEIIDIIQEDLMFNYYNKPNNIISGEMIIKKIK